MNMLHSTIYPFTAIIGQKRIKKALILSAINPRIGGILIYGEKGTAKATAARGLSLLLPEINTVEGCYFNCDPKYKNNICESCKKKFHALHYIKIIKKKVPFVELPISVTEDSLIGALDFQDDIKGEKYKFKPGALAKANRGIVYVDEINLLDNHIVGTLLNTAAKGINVLEKENISYSHASQFITVGTMDPREGELSQQLLDCFGLCVKVERITKSYERLEIIKRKKEFEKDPLEFIAKFSDKEKKLKNKIIKAKENFAYVNISRKIIRFIDKYCIEASITWNKVDVIIRETACTIAAYLGHDNVTEEHVQEAVELVMSYRGKDTANIRYRIREKMYRSSN